MSSCRCHFSLCHLLRWCALLLHQSQNTHKHISSDLWLLFERKTNTTVGQNACVCSRSFPFKGSQAGMMVLRACILVCLINPGVRAFISAACFQRWGGGVKPKQGRVYPCSAAQEIPCPALRRAKHGSAGAWARRGRGGAVPGHSGSYQTGHIRWDSCVTALHNGGVGQAFRWGAHHGHRTTMLAMLAAMTPHVCAL